MGTNKTVVSNKFTFGKQDFKYFVGYKDNKEISSLYTLRYSDKHKCVYFIIKD